MSDLDALLSYLDAHRGEAERLNAMKTLNPAFASANEQAAYLRTEKGLMLDRLTEKERQIRDVMGPEYLDSHPVMTPELKARVVKEPALEKAPGSAAAGAGGADDGQVMDGGVHTAIIAKLVGFLVEEGIAPDAVGGWLRWLGWLSTAVMGAAGLGMFTMG